MSSIFGRLAAAVCQEPDAPLATIRECGDVDHDEQFVLLDRKTGLPLRNQPYEIKGPGVFCSGSTNDQGATQRVFTGGRPEPLRVSTLKEEAGMQGAQGVWDGCE